MPETAENADTCRYPVTLAPAGGRQAHIRGLLLPQGLPVPAIAAGTATCRYAYHCTTAHGSGQVPFLTGACVIHAPSLSGIWARAFAMHIPGVRGLVLDRAWADAGMRLAWLSLRLKYERLRLGSDVESPSLRRLVRHENLHRTLPSLTIGQWLDAIARARRFSPPDRDFILWQDRTPPAAGKRWLAARLHHSL